MKSVASSMKMRSLTLPILRSQLSVVHSQGSLSLSRSPAATLILWSLTFEAVSPDQGPDTIIVTVTATSGVATLSLLPLQQIGGF
jgi:hypothetical protein